MKLRWMLWLKLLLVLWAMPSCIHSLNLAIPPRQEASDNYGSTKSHFGLDQQLIESQSSYLEKIQPIFNNRCIACHSCLNSPCQLNLTSFAGLDRGATKDDIYNRREIGNKTPTRLGIDVPGTFEAETQTLFWRKPRFIGSNGTHAFFPVINRTESNPAERINTSVLAQLLTVKNAYNQAHKPGDQNLPPYTSERSRICPDQGETKKVPSAEVTNFISNIGWAGMPYGFPALSPSENNEIIEWIKKGATPPTFEETYELTKATRPQTLKTWEQFFNTPDFRHRITARYIYEHLFLAHIYFDDMPGEFFRFIRAQCDALGKNCHELPTRRPTDDAKESEFFNARENTTVYYKFQKVTSALVHKAHSPFQLNSTKLEKWKALFIDKIPEPANPARAFPGYTNVTAGNPFMTFSAIPPKSRYQFLLDDSYFFIMSFIKGPVCNGSAALSVIDDHFWVFFLKPDSDVTLNHPEFFQEAGEKLAVPAIDGNDWTFLQIFKQRRRDGRILKKSYLNRFLTRGYNLNDVWNGDGVNPNAVLTIYRHEDSASVSRGALGETPKTMWMLDYPIFEDIYYNLVGTYDVYAPLVHALKSRLHMDASRFNGQDTYLAFLPQPLRLPIRQQWTREKSPTKPTPHCTILPAQLCAIYNQSANAMRDIVYPYASVDHPSEIKFTPSGSPPQELAQLILKSFSSAVVENTTDTINKHLPGRLNFVSRTDLTMKDSEDIFSMMAGKPGNFASWLPELSYIQVYDTAKGHTQWYTLIHNRERYNVAFFDEIVPESERLWLEKDSINILKGFVGSYANAIFSVPLNRLPEFSNAILDLKDEASLKAFYKQFLVSRHNPEFWMYFDDMNYFAKQKGITPYSDPYEGSILDLNRYINDDGF